jgi:pimeloyl-ACP methyl ester carboxylesterase
MYRYCNDVKFFKAKIMRGVRVSFVMAAFVAAPSAFGQSPATLKSPAGAHGGSSARSRADVATMMRYEATGLSLLRPYERDKVPVVFVHGLWSNPCSWAAMIESLNADPVLYKGYQFWTFGYSTGDPIPYSALLLRSNLEEVRHKFDPERANRAFDQTVIVGHSMGGLLTKMMVQETGARLWQIVSDRPVDKLTGDPEDLNLFRRALIYNARPEVRRVIMIATPHRGSPIDQGPLGHLGSRLIRLPDPLRASYNRLIARNSPDFFKERFRRGLPTSVDELEWRSPILTRLDELGLVSTVKAHSIIADLRDPPRAGGSDGMVPYASAHLDGLASELLVSSGHLCQDKPAVIREVRRILIDHLGQ